MATADLKTTSFDPDELKASLIEFLQSTDEFGDFNYDGSAINTIVDLLTRNTTYTAYLANMLANESFLDSAQIRGNVVSHAQKLSYVPKSATAATAVVDLLVVPSGPITANIIYADTSLQLLSNDGTNTYTFVLPNSISLTYDVETGVYSASDVEFKQGNFVRSNFVYNGSPITIPNKNIDTSTVNVYVNDDIVLKYEKATSITQLGSQQTVFFLREKSTGLFEIAFGSDNLGIEPSDGAIVTVEYINTQDDHANGASTFIAASTIDGYSNIQVTTTTPAFGGTGRDDIEDIRSNAPRYYRSQDRALSPIDYSTIVKNEFPFISSAFSWGGEDNDPPRYGSVFISVIPENDLVVTDFLKTRIENVVKTKNVGSVTPVVVEPDIFDVNIHCRYTFNRDTTRKTNNEIEAIIKNGIEEYNSDSLGKFDSYYNESNLISRLKQNAELESVMLTETMSIALEPVQFNAAHYDIEFRNELVEGSILVEDFVIETLSNNQTIYDEDGDIIYSRTVDNVTRKDTIGTVDYSTGYVTFYTSFTQDNDAVISTKPVYENIYVSQNGALRIGSISLEEMSR